MDIQQVIDGISLLTYGLVAREGFYLRVSRKEEKELQILLWAAFWAVPLKVFFDEFGKYEENQLYVLATNIAIVLAGGYMVGALCASYADWKANKDKNVKYQYPKMLLAALNPLSSTPASHALQEFFRVPRRKWILVELHDGRFVFGSVKAYNENVDGDSRGDLVVRNPRLMTREGLLEGIFAEEFFIHMGAIKGIRKNPTDPDATKP